MASCIICHKSNSRGYRVSHSSIKTKRIFKANLHNLRSQIDGKTIQTVKLCSKCYKKIRKDFWAGKKLPIVPISLLNQKKLKVQTSKTSVS